MTLKTRLRSPKYNHSFAMLHCCLCVSMVNFNVLFKEKHTEYRQEATCMYPEADWIPRCIVYNNKVMSYCSNTWVPHHIKENLSHSPQPTDSTDDHGMCMTNLPALLTCNMTTFRRKNVWPLNPSQGSSVCVRAKYLLAYYCMFHSL